MANNKVHSVMTSKHFFHLKVVAKIVENSRRIVLGLLIYLPLTVLQAFSIPLQPYFFAQ